MKDVRPSTINESKMIKGIQKAMGALDNGIIGCQTLSDIAKKLCPEVFPLTLQVYGCPTIIAKDIIACDPNGPIKVYENSISGSFTYPSSDKPCSILINRGKDIYSSACHAWLGKTESVIYRYKDGTFGMSRHTSTADIPNRNNVVWAIGGMGLGNMYSPVTEGFSGKYADVLRKTNHTVLGIKDGFCYLVYVPNMNVTQIQNLIKNKMKFEKALLLDGGHIAAINGSERFAEINMNQYQGYLIQGV